MFDDASALIDELLAREPASFVSHFIFEAVPFAFGNDLTGWIEWKSLLGSLIDVDPRNIVMTGSAAVGFSLNPDKGFRRFDSESDFDCGVVSDHYFSISWRYLSQQRVEWLSLARSLKQAIEMHRKNYVFSGTIAADTILSLLPFGRDWQTALDLMSAEQPSTDRDIKLRIYKDYDSLRQYQVRGVTRLRDRVLEEQSGDSDSTEIVVQEED